MAPGGLATTFITGERVEPRRASRVTWVGVGDRGEGTATASLRRRQREVGFPNHGGKNTRGWYSFYQINYRLVQESQEKMGVGNGDKNPPPQHLKPGSSSSE